MSRLFLFSLLFIVCGLPLQAQRHMSLEEAVSTGLEANRTIDRFQIRRSIALRRNTPGAAGRLPSLQLTSRAAFGLNYSKQEYFNGETQNTSGASDLSIQSGLQMDYLLYEGNAKDLRAEGLGRDVEIAELDLQQNLRLLTADIAAAYSELTWRSRRLEIRKEYLEYLRQLLDLEEQKAELGSVSSMAVLQAKTDYRQALIALEREELALERSKLILDNLLYKDEAEAYSVDSTFIPVDGIPDALPQLALDQNPELVRMRLQEQQAGLDIRLNESQRYPVIGAYAGLYHTYGRSGSGFLTSNRNVGPEIGLSLNYPIFDGHRVDREIEIAKLELERSRVETEESVRSVKRALDLSQSGYESLQNMLDWAEEQVELNVQQLELARQQYRAGRITVFDYRQSRQQWLDARLQYLDFRYELVIEQINLRYLAGMEIF